MGSECSRLCKQMKLPGRSRRTPGGKGSETANSGDDICKPCTNVIITGPQQGGKTALWCRIVYPIISADNLVAIISPTEIPQCERVVFATHDCVLWDLPGNQILNKLSLTSFSMLDTSLIFFVIPLYSTLQEFEVCHEQIQELIVTTKNRNIKIMVILNVLSNQFNEDGSLTEIGQQKLVEALLILNVAFYQQENPTTFIWYIGDILNRTQQIFSDSKVSAFLEADLLS